MKILIIDTSLDGHHWEYINSLISIDNLEKILIIPNDYPKINRNDVKVYPYDLNIKKKNIFKYIRWMSYIKKIAKKENVDKVHFLNGDSIMKFMGIGMSTFGKKLIITYHNFYFGYLRKWSYKKSLKKAQTAVVHTNIIKNLFLKFGITNIVCIDYPSFIYNDEIKNKKEIRVEFNLPENKYVIGLIGGLSFYKGIDKVIEIIPRLNGKQCLFIAGKTIDIDSEIIKSIAKEYPNIIVFKEGWLSKDDYVAAIKACDMILLPYKSFFYGASGPLADGVHFGKTIIATDIGSIGNIVREKHLGFVFNNNDNNKLVQILNCKECYEYSYDSTAIEYALSLSPKVFQKKYYDQYEI